MNESKLNVVRVQARSLARLRENRYRGQVHIKAADAVILIDAGLRHDRFQRPGDSEGEKLPADDALKNYWLTTQRDCLNRLDACERKQKRNGERIDTDGVLAHLSFHDFATLVDSAEQVVDVEHGNLHSGAGSGAAGDRFTAGDPQPETVRDAPGGGLVVPGENETLGGDEPGEGKVDSAGT